MAASNQHNILTLAIVVSMLALAGCTKQNWYQGAQSAQTAQCMKEPLAEYEDCNQQSKESYQDYSSNKAQLQTQESKTDY